MRARRLEDHTGAPVHAVRQIRQRNKTSHVLLTSSGHRYSLLKSPSASIVIVDLHLYIRILRLLQYKSNKFAAHIVIGMNSVCFTYLLLHFSQIIASCHCNLSRMLPRGPVGTLAGKRSVVVCQMHFHFSVDSVLQNISEPCSIASSSAESPYISLPTALCTSSKCSPQALVAAQAAIILFNPALAPHKPTIPKFIPFNPPSTL